MKPPVTMHLLPFLVALVLPLSVAAADDGPTVMTYRTVNDQELRAYVFSPEGEAESASAVLLFHGGGWSVGSPEWTFNAARRFATAGMVAIPIEYRLSIGEITPIDALDDVCAAFRWVRENGPSLGVDPERVAGYGVSAGGHLVTSTATVGCADEGDDQRSSPDALLLWSPALDLTHDGWFERKLQGRATAGELSPAAHVNGGTPPTSIVHGEADTLTPAAGAETYCENLRAASVRCEVHLYAGVGHLLTRNLEQQERDFDPDPEAVADGIERHLAFLRDLGYID